MIATEHSSALLVCVDCYFAGNGLELDDSTPELEPLSRLEGLEVTPGWLWEEHDCVNAVDIDPWRGPVDCDCEEIPFSSRPCDGCGSSLAGSRHALTVWWKGGDDE